MQSVKGRDEDQNKNFAILRFILVITSFTLYLTYLLRALTLLQTYFIPILMSLESKAQKIPSSLRIHVLLI
jgi:hypothetical protein